MRSRQSHFGAIAIYNLNVTVTKKTFLLSCSIIVLSPKKISIMKNVLIVLLHMVLPTRFCPKCVKQPRNGSILKVYLFIFL